MKIIFMANTIFGENPGLSGGESRFIEIAKFWASKGHEIHLMSSDGCKTLCKNLGLEVVFHNISNSKSITILTFIIRAIKSTFFLPSSLKDFNEGVIYSTNEMISDVIPAFRLKARNRKNIKWATVVHWLPPFPPWKRKEANFLNATLFFINERFSVWLSNRFADVLLAVSSMTAQQLKHARADISKVHSVECGVNYAEIRKIAQGVEQKIYDAVFMKRLQAVKGVFDLIDIWEMVVKRKPEAKLLVIGEGIDGEKAKQMVKQKGLDRSIEFTGTIYDGKDKVRKIAQSKMFVLPSYEENWAIVIGEAMACGTPVISYGLKELIDIWQDNSFWVPVGDKISFAKKIIDLLDTPAILNDVSHKGIDYVKKYDWRNIAEKEMKIIAGEKKNESF